jgi:hypothetical protein
MPFETADGYVSRETSNLNAESDWSDSSPRVWPA